jgi:hypothetical protein
MRRSSSYPRFLATAAYPPGFQSIVQVVNTRVISVKCEGDMLWTIFVILLVLWLLGVVTSYTMGGFIHLLLILAVVALVFQLITGRRAAI